MKKAFTLFKLTTVFFFCSITSFAQRIELSLTEEQYLDTTAPIGTINAGDAIKYTYYIYNSSGQPLTNVYITDATQTIVGSPVNLAEFESSSGYFTSTRIINNDDFNLYGGFVAVQPIVHGTLPSGTEISNSLAEQGSNPLFPNCHACIYTKIPDTYPSISVIYEDIYQDTTAPFGLVNVGDKINYEVSLQNTGRIPLQEVKVFGKSHYNYNYGIGTYEYSSSLGNTLSTLAAGATDNTTFSKSYTITQNDIENGYIFDDCVVTGKSPNIIPDSGDYWVWSVDPTPCTVDCPPLSGYDAQGNYYYSNNNSNRIKLKTITVNVYSYWSDTILPAGLPNVGETVYYTYILKNKTLSNLTNVTVTDSNATVTGTLASLNANSEDTTSFTGTHTITQADIKAGFIINTAVISGQYNGQLVQLNSSTKKIILYKDAFILVSEDTYNDIVPIGISNIGDSISYSIKLVNNRNFNLANVSLSSSNLTITGDSLPLMVAETINNTAFSAVHTITQEDLNTGYVYANLLAQGNTTIIDPNSDIQTTYYAEVHDPTPCVNCNINSNCEFCITTSLLFNKIKLNAFVDANANGVKDTGENDFPLGKFKYNINDSATINEVITTNGIYFLHESNSFNTYDLNFSVLPEFAYNYATSTTYSDVTIGANVVTYYFPVTVLPYNDTEINLVTIGAPPRPGFTYQNVVSYTNNGNQTVANGTVTFTKNNVSSLISISEAGATITPTGFTFNFTNLLPFETRTITVTMQNPTIPIVDFGQVLTNVAAISIPTNDININNNTSSLSQSIVGSFDPNDKSESHNGEILHNTFSANDYLTYTIRFENTGNYPADFVTVVDQLETKLDENTLRMVAASHPYTLKRTGKNLTWHFDDIQLQPSLPNSTIGHGYIIFKIKPISGYAIGDVISNISNIYFDYNPPIITNVCSTEFVPTLSNPSFMSSSFEISPNPVKDVISISSSKEFIKYIEIYSALGQLMLDKLVEDSNAKFDISNFNKGIYFVKINGVYSNQSFKIIKD